MDLVVQRAGVDVGAVCTPAHRRDWTAYLEHAHGCFGSLVSALPYPHRSIIGSRSHQFNSSTARHCPVEGIDDTPVRTKPPHPLAGGEVSDVECLICGYSVQDLREQ